MHEAALKGAHEGQHWPGGVTVVAPAGHDGGSQLTPGHESLTQAGQHWPGGVVSVDPGGHIGFAHGPPKHRVVPVQTGQHWPGGVTSF